MKLYLAGPMRGIEHHNFPAFDGAAGKLRAIGLEVFNPADHDREIGFDESTVDVPEGTLQAMMRWDLARVMEVDAVVFLPGWERSKGACAERTVAHYLGLPCFDFVLVDVHAHDDVAHDPDVIHGIGWELRRQAPYEEPLIEWRLKKS